MAERNPKAVTPRLRFPEFRRSSDWGTIELRQLAEFVTERVGAADCIPYTITSGVGLVSQQEKLGRTIAGNSLKNYIQLQRNDFAYNKSATKAFPQGFIARFVGDERAAVPNSIFTCFRLVNEVIDPGYLDDLFSTNLHGNWLRSRIAVGARAHGSLNVSDDDLMALPIPLPSGPSSLAEQKKIAECLTSLDEVIAAQGRKVEALKAHKRGLMQQLFPRDDETSPRLRFPEFRDAAEWESVGLASVCRVQRGKFSHRPRNDPKFFGGRYPFIQTGDVVRADGGAVVASQSLNELGLSVSKLFRPTIVLITIAANIGDTALLCVDACFTDSVIGLTPTRGRVTPRFLELVMRLKKQHLNQVATTGAQKNINIEILESLEVLIPSIGEQEQIEGCLSSLESQIAAESDRLAALKTHKQGLMQQLFPAPDTASA